MSTTVATSLPPAGLAESDSLRQCEGLSRAEALRAAVRWYIGSADMRAFADPMDDEIDP